MLGSLIEWFGRGDRKPLVLRGARQVGKTWVVRELARRANVDLVELNFERAPELAEIFTERSPDSILAQIERLEGRRINKAKALLFLDEIQKAPKVFAGLRWFYEECPQLAVVATGSLLDFVLREHEFSMPVGRISYMFLEPMSLSEFLLACGEEPLAAFLTEATVETAIPDVIHDKLARLFRRYVTVGGLPSVVAEWTRSGSPIAVAQVQQDILNTYADDFAKYAGRIPTDRLRKVMLSVPRLLGRKFKYCHVDRDETPKAVKRALELLCLARLCHKVASTHGRGVPLAAEESDTVFKVIFLDVGLVSAMQGVSLTLEKELDDLIRVNRGGFAEQAVGQMLRASEFGFLDPVLYYHTRERPGSESELDYLLQHGTRVVPIEVKSGKTGTLKSLHQFMAERRYDCAVRINTERPSMTDVDVKTTQGASARYKLLSIPFYLTPEIRRLVSS